MKLFILMIVLCAVEANAATYISEINYDPEGSDNGKEYVEIFSDEDINLSGFVITDFKSEDALKQVKYFYGNYSLITEENFNYSGLNITVYSVGATIGNGLNNDRDAIILKNISIIDVVAYSNSIGGEGNALCIENFLLKRCEQTPGKENEFNENKTGEDSNISLEISEVMPDPNGKDASPMPGGEWIEIHNKGESAIDLEGFYIADEKGNRFTISSVTTMNTTLIEPEAYLLVYGNGKGMMNNDADAITLFDKNNATIDKVSYTYSREGLSWSRFGDMFLISRPSQGLKNIEELKNTSSEIKITGINEGNDEEARFGDIVYVNVEVDKGNTTKNSLKIYAKNISKQTRFTMPERIGKTSFTIPLQLDPNCDGKYKDGFYDIIVEGLDAQSADRILVKGNSSYCKTKEIHVAEATSSVKSNAKELPIERIINQSVALSRIYISSDEKAKRTAIFIFSAVMLLMLVTLGIGKWQ